MKVQQRHNQVKPKENNVCNLEAKEEVITDSFVRRKSSEIRKLFPKNPRKHVAVLKHIFDQCYKSPRKRELMDKLWSPKEKIVGSYLLELGIRKGQKNPEKLKIAVEKLKNNFKSLREVSRLTDCSWTKLYRFTNLTKKCIRKESYNRKLSSLDIRKITEHMQEDGVSMPLPDKKHAGKRFFRSSVRVCHNMYNILPSTSRKISLSTYYKYKPKHIKLQGKIPYRQSVCERCENFERVIEMSSKYLEGVPSTLDACVDSSMCPYQTFFPNIKCATRDCQSCGTDLLKEHLKIANEDKLQDNHKRFMVKQWVNKTRRRNDVLQTYLHWNFLRMSYSELLDLYIDELELMSEHVLFATWNYCQYKMAKRNIGHGDIIFVHDFAQNYLCLHQNEPQGLHWEHEQVTLHPTVAHYLCQKDNCGGLVTHEVVHVSDDLKHDAHLVNKFNNVTINVLKESNVTIRKIIEFSDQAPSQYKNKTAFRYLSQSKIPTMRNFFGVRHGKGPCDACTGRVKQALTKLVKAGTEVINSADSLYSAAKKHLETKPSTDTHECQHFFQTFHFTRKLRTRPNTKKWNPIPDTRARIHTVANTGNAQEVIFRKISCMCCSCVRGTGTCENENSSVIPDNWCGYNMQQKEDIIPSLDFWKNIRNIPDSPPRDNVTASPPRDNIRNIPDSPSRHNVTASPPRDNVPVNPVVHSAPLNGPLNNVHVPQHVPPTSACNWAKMVREMSALKSYADLQMYVRRHPIPYFTGRVQLNMQPNDYPKVYDIARHHFPRDGPTGYLPVTIGDDGNCFPRTLSYLCFRNQSHHVEMRVRLVYEAVINKQWYLNEEYVKRGAEIIHKRGTTIQQWAMFAKNYDPTSREPLNVPATYKQEVLDICHDSEYTGMWQILQAANVLRQPIYSVYPNYGCPSVRKDMNRQLYCINSNYNQKQTIYVMWTPLSITSQFSCHFVPLLKTVQNSVIHIRKIIYNCTKNTDIYVYLIVTVILCLQISEDASH